MAKKNTQNASVSKKQAEREARLKRAKRKQLIRIFIVLGAILLIAGITTGIVFAAKSCKEKKDTPPREVSYATIEVANYGNIVVRLDDENAPETVERFVKYAKNGSYNGLEFTKKENGCLYTDYDKDWSTIFGEFYKNNVNNQLSHKKGVISMIRGEDYNSANGAFFFTTEDKSSELDKSYAAFGEITSGMEIIEKIAKDVAENDGSKANPSITKITIETKTESAK